jgi:DNA-binding NtrC family response regulator
VGSYTLLLDKVVYQSAVMQQIRKELAPVIESVTPILFWGEPGSGMGFYAKAVHEASARPGKFLKISGFSLDEETIAQQFLGIDDQPGWLEEADQGTIFLKRIAEVPPAGQQMLFHFMQHQTVDGRLQFARKGSSENKDVNIRLICSLASDLDIAIHDGLLYRGLGEEIKKRGKIIHLPPLRERKEDIIAIAANFLEWFNQKYHQSITAIDDSAQDIFGKYAWPGNIDELQRVIEGVFGQYPGITTITAAHLPDYVKNLRLTENTYSFKLKDEVKFTGWIRSKSLKIQIDDKKLSLNTADIAEILRVEDMQFSPPKFKHFVVKLKDGSQKTGKILDKTMQVETPFDRSYQINPQDLYAVFLF